MAGLHLCHLAQDDQILDEDDNVHISFVNNVATLQIRSVDNGHSGRYTCQAKNESGVEVLCFPFSTRCVSPLSEFFSGDNFTSNTFLPWNYEYDSSMFILTTEPAQIIEKAKSVMSLKRPVTLGVLWPGAPELKSSGLKMGNRLCLVDIFR